MALPNFRNNFRNMSLKFSSMDDSSITLRVRQVIRERYDVKTFVFERLDGQLLLYSAGQFLTFLMEVNGHQIRRSYSMSSAPGVDRYPAITVKRISNGEVSRFWVDRVEEGAVFQVLAPAGRFTLDEAGGKPRDIILIGAGSGITPLYSIMKQVLTDEPNSFVRLFYANKNEASTLFREGIGDLECRFPDRVKVIHIHSQAPDDWTGVRGRLNNIRLEQMLAGAIHFRQQDARFFICGPYEFMRTIEITLHYLTFTSDQIRKENFVIDKIPPPPRVSFPYQIKLDLRGKHYTLLVPAHTTVLDAALAAGIQLPYSCKGGRCSTCACICTSGKIHMSVNEVLTDRDLAQGWILACSSFVDSEDVSLKWD
jgi:ring-1,2-phenylacetyl-CoA epoxidase subunit PaaE